MYLVVDKTSKFKEENFTQAVSKMEGDNDLMQIVESKGKKTKKNTETTELRGVINLVISKNFGPTICFSFSKSECENFA